MGGTRGRPRSEPARLAVLDAALHLCERDGYQQLTIKGIADLAGVGRQTVYRWWPHKVDVLLEALVELFAREQTTLTPDTGDALQDVRVLLEATFEMHRRLTAPAVVGLMVDAQHDCRLAEQLQRRLLGPRRRVLREVLRRGVERGEFASSAPLDLVVDFAFGTMWYRLLSRHATVDQQLAAEITDAVAKLLAPEITTGND